MPAPEPLKCGLCDYTTPPACPTWDHMLKTLELHNAQMHVTDKNVKKEKISRPTLRENINEADFNFFENEWKRYRRTAKLSDTEAVDQLWSCATEDLKRQCFDHGANLENTNEENLLALLKVNSIQAQNKLVDIVHFLNLKQGEDKPISKFIARVRGQAKVCDFKTRCTKTGCGHENSYSEQLSAHIIVKGLVNPEIQERILALAATSEDDLDLKKITEFVYAHETGTRSRKLLNESMSINRMSLYKQNKRGQLSDKCSYCGEKGHGSKAPFYIREKKCPAFDKKCTKCKRPHHIASQCKSKAEANALECSSQSDTDDDHSEAELGEFGWFAMTAKENASKNKIQNQNNHVISHHTVDKFGKWKINGAEPQPEVTVQVSVS